jgi:hypothetical protein
MGAVVTLVVFSFLLKENPAWRLVEHIYIGFAAAHGIAMGYLSIKNLAWTPITTKGQYYLIIPCLLGISLYARFFKSGKWVARYPMAFLVGAGNGMILKGIIQAQFIAQVKATMVPITFAKGFWPFLGNLVIVLGTAATLFYFYFSMAEKGRMDRGARTFGRWIMMMAFGATFGNAVMGEMTLFIGRLQFLYGDWLKIIGK